MSIPNSVIEKFRRFDPALKLSERQGPDPQKPGETCLMIRVERKKANGCYEHIGWCRPDLLGDGTMFLNKLHRNDVRTYGGGAKAADAYDKADRDERLARKAQHRDHIDQISKAAFETHIKRRTGERVSNAGVPGVA